MATLSRLAAKGSIHEEAPVTTRLEVRIIAPPAKVWALLVDASSWPKWQQGIDSVSVAGPLQRGTGFTWVAGGTTIHSQVQLFEPERRLSWTGTAMTAKAVHVWELKALPGDQTLVVMRESMDGLLMAKMYPSAKLEAADRAWLASLKLAAEQKP
ncbi:SRPBCC domain-containing protein [Granulicella arctica]|uniref:SRPBCC domain-containing protein n=1 Tax=Granulicella arctica TaxID=940613 RepID=UPI0021DFE0E2|nr:SRPBCC domain-containing protein [Granulicella arctica]